MRRGEIVAGAGGILLFVSLFLSWYVVDPPGANLVAPALAGATPTAWRVFTVTDIVLALLALLAVAVPLVSLATDGPAKSIGTAVIASTLGWIAVILVAVKLVDPPFDVVKPDVGAWLALAGALIAWVGSWLSLRDESTPGAVLPELPRRPAPPPGDA